MSRAAELSCLREEERHRAVKFDVRGLAAQLPERHADGTATLAARHVFAGGVAREGVSWRCLGGGPP